MRQLDDLRVPELIRAGGEGAHEVHDHLQPPRRVDDVEEMEVLLQSIVEEVVDLTQPLEGRLVLGREGGMDVDENVARVDVLIQRAHQVH